MANILMYQNWLNENLIFEKNNSLYTDWKGSRSGPFLIFPPVEKRAIIGIGAKNGKPDAFVLVQGAGGSKLSAWSKVTPPASTPPVNKKPQIVPPAVIPSLDFEGKNFPYPDNIITPNWTGAKEAKVEFDDFIILLIEYFKLDPVQAKNNFKSIAIEGAADIANATRDIPNGYTKLDHNYGGAEANNEFLAENRAIKMKEEITKALTGKLTPELVTFITGKITTTFKTGLARGERSVKITTVSTSYNVKTPGSTTPGTNTPGTDIPGKVGDSGKTSNTYSVLNDYWLQYFFGDSSEFKIDSSAIFLDGSGSKIEITALQNWAKKYLGGELLNADEVANLTATIVTQDPTGPELTISFNVPNGKVFAPRSRARNQVNSIKCSEANSTTLNLGIPKEVRTGFPFVIYYEAYPDAEGTKFGRLAFKSIAIGPEFSQFDPYDQLMLVGQPKP